MTTTVLVYATAGGHALSCVLKVVPHAVSRQIEPRRQCGSAAAVPTI